MARKWQSNHTNTLTKKNAKGNYQKDQWNLKQSPKQKPNQKQHHEVLGHKVSYLNHLLRIIIQIVRKKSINLCQSLLEIKFSNPSHPIQLMLCISTINYYNSKWYNRNKKDITKFVQICLPQGQRKDKYKICSNLFYIYEQFNIRWFN